MIKGFINSFTIIFFLILLRLVPTNFQEAVVFTGSVAVLCTSIYTVKNYNPETARREIYHIDFLMAWMTGGLSLVLMLMMIGSVIAVSLTK